MIYRSVHRRTGVFVLYECIQYCTLQYDAWGSITAASLNLHSVTCLTNHSLLYLCTSHIARLRHFIFLHLSSTHQNQDPHTAAMPATTAETLSLVNRTVSVAPLVLLSATDHYARSAKGTKKRVVGVLLGQNDGKNVRVSNSFAGKYYGDAPMPRCHF